jgi:hypothetical protein
MDTTLGDYEANVPYYPPHGAPPSYNQVMAAEQGRRFEGRESSDKLGNLM